MLITIYIEEEILQDKVTDVMSEIFFGQKGAIKFLREKLPSDVQTNALIDFSHRCAGFRLIVDLYINTFNTYEEVYPYIHVLSNVLQSRIFIDDSEHYGNLFVPDQPMKRAKFELTENEGEDDYLIILEVYDEGTSIPEDTL